MQTLRFPILFDRKCTMHTFCTRIFIPLQAAFLCLLLLSTPACSILSPDADFHEITLVNDTGKPLVYFVLTPESASLSYFGHEIKANSDGSFGSDASILQPGASVTLSDSDVSGGPRQEDGLVFFIYRINGDVGVLDMFAMSSKRLKQAGFRVEIGEQPVRRE